MKYNWIDSFLVFILSGAILFAVLGNHLFNPNQFVFAFGGDAAVLYYNLIYHSLYGSGLQLSNMNYPMGESLLLTDAQASVTLVLNKLSSFEYVKDNLIGFYHAFHYICIGLAAMFMHRSFLKLGVNRWLSILGALLIVFLSPQLFRLRGHFGLAYPIMFTACIYALISFRLERKWIHACLLFCVLFFFGMNNIYLLVLAVGLCSFYLLFDYLFFKDKSSLYLLPFAILPLGLVFFLIKWTSPEMDRLIIQWGYAENSMKIEGLFYPYTSLLGTILQKAQTNVENVCALGFANTLGLMLLPLSLLLRKTRIGMVNLFTTKTPLGPLLLSSIILLIYSSGVIMTLAEAVPAATMFKASGRFAWPFFYAVSVFTIVAFNQLWEHEYWKDKKTKYLLLIPLVIWIGEDFNYLKNRVGFKQYDTPYSPPGLHDVRKQLTDNNIDLSNYQALYGLPTMEAWNDKFHLKIPFHTEFNCIRISMATGLPMINGMLSRIGLTQAGEAIQFASHPWIKKTILSKLDDRPILLVHGKESELTEGEEYLKSKAELLLDAKTFALYKILPDDLLQAEIPACKEASFDYVFKDYNELKSELSFTGSGALMVTEVQSIFKLDQLQDRTKFAYNDMSMSLYVLATNKKYGMPWIKAVQFDKERNKIQEDHFDVASSKDIVDNWRRVEFLFDKKEETDSLSISLEMMNQDFIVDNFLLRSQRDTFCHYHSIDSSQYLINNYLIEN